MFTSRLGKQFRKPRIYKINSKLYQKKRTKRIEKSNAVREEKFQESVDKQNFKKFALYLTFWVIKG